MTLKFIISTFKGNLLPRPFSLRKSGKVSISSLRSPSSHYFYDPNIIYTWWSSSSSYYFTGCRGICYSCCCCWFWVAQVEERERESDWWESETPWIRTEHKPLWTWVSAHPKNNWSKSLLLSLSLSVPPAHRGSFSVVFWTFSPSNLVPVLLFDEMG